MIQEITQASTCAFEASTCTFEVGEVCQVLGVSRSGYYAHRHKDQRLRRREDRALARHIQSAFEDSLSTYGSPRLVRELKKRGVRTSKTRVRRLMKSEGLCPRQKRRVRVAPCPCSAMSV